MDRCLYLLNTETGERAEQTDVTGMKPMQIIEAEARLWAMVSGDEWVVRDSRDD